MQTPQRTFTLIADLDSTDRADKYLAALFEQTEDLSSVSRSQVQKLIENGSITIAGQKIRTKDKIPSGTEIQVILPEPEALVAEPENIPLKVLYEDEHLIVINKQPGLTVHPSETQKKSTLVNALLFHVKDLSGIGGVLRPGIVHRIDKDTSGALVVTKTDEAHAGLSKLFATHTIERKYWALVYGAPNWDQTYRFTSTIDRHPNDRKKMAINVQGGRHAASNFTRLESYGVPGKQPFASLVEAKLETGRTHQVRAHLTHLQHSLLGDKIYGTVSDQQPKWKALPNTVQAAVEKLPGQALHARVLGFKHPVTGVELHFEAEPYPDFQNLLDELKKFTG